LIVIVSQCFYANYNQHFNIARYEDQQSLNVTAIIITKELSTESANTEQIIGECKTEITYANCSTLSATNFTWYLNESKVNYENTIYGYQEDSGKLSIRNTKTAANYTGLYLCVTTFPGGLGSYVTAATNLVLMQAPTTGSFVHRIYNVVMVFVSTETSDDSLPSWAIAVIVVISAIAVGILLVVGLVVLQLKVGWVRSGFTNSKSRMHRSKSQYSEKSQSSRDQLIKQPVKRLSSKISQRSSKKASQIKGSYIVNPVTLRAYNELIVCMHVSVWRVRSNRDLHFFMLQIFVVDKWEIEYDCIVFEEVMHEGTFKNAHRAVIGTHNVVVKKLRGL